MGSSRATVAPGSLIVALTDWSGYAGLGKARLCSTSLLPSVVIQNPVAEQYLPIIHLVFAKERRVLLNFGIVTTSIVSHQHLESLPSTSSPSAFNRLGSTRSTPSAHCSASRRDTSASNLSPSFTREEWRRTLNVAVMGVNRIGKGSFCAELCATSCSLCSG